MNKVLREEKKFLLSYPEFICKSNTLEQVLLQDKHNGPNGYTIRSLYFDTPFDSDFYEKQAGTEMRRKIRLRIGYKKKKLHWGTIERGKINMR